MKEIIKTTLAVALATTITGCGMTTPAAPPQPLTNMEAFTVILPNNVAYSDTWNIDFRPFQNEKRGSSAEIRKHFKANYKKVNNSELESSFCNTETFSSTGSQYKSCVTYLSDVVTKDLGDATQVTIQPKLRSEVKGGLLIPISIPKVDNMAFYGYLSSQKVTIKNKITSEYPSEAIKGNFDRMATSYKWGGEADAAHRQFKDSYIIRTSTGIEGRISAGFYPYREGSIVQYVVDGLSSNNSATRSVDWQQAMAEIQKRIEEIVNS